MGTRGSYGFRVDGEDRLAYNHFDSYPEGLGQDIYDSLRCLLDKYSLDELKDKVRKIELVKENSSPSPEQIKRLEGYADSQVSSGKIDEWYVLLRDMQGDIKAHVEEGIMISGGDFIYDSLYCEWAYIVNLDEEVFEVYRGFQRMPNHGRYQLDGTNHKNGYYPCSLIATFPLDNLPTDTIQQIIAIKDKEETEAL